MKVSLIVAHDLNLAIGKDGDLLWAHGTQKADMRRFREVTTGHIVIMGRKTWESIPKSYRPLKDRHNVVLTSNPSTAVNILSEGGFPELSLEAVIQDIEESPSHKEVFIIGGESIYHEALNIVDEIYSTLIHKEYEGCDAFIRGYRNDFSLNSEEYFEADKDNHVAYTFQHWLKK